MSADDVASLLEGARKSTGGWIARCPTHEDRAPSLSVHNGKRGTIIHCHASCRTADICQAIGLTVAQLFADYSEKRTGSNSTIDAMLRKMVKKNRADTFVPVTLGDVMGIAFTGEHEDWFRAYEKHADVMDLPFDEAYKMWFVTADVVVKEYLRPWWDTLDPKTRDWHEIREAAMKKLFTTMRERKRYADGY